MLGHEELFHTCDVLPDEHVHVVCRSWRTEHELRAEEGRLDHVASTAVTPVIDLSRAEVLHAVHPDCACLLRAFTRGRDFERFVFGVNEAADEAQFAVALLLPRQEHTPAVYHSHIDCLVNLRCLARARVDHSASEVGAEVACDGDVATSGGGWRWG